MLSLLQKNHRTNSERLYRTAASCWRLAADAVEFACIARGVGMSASRAKEFREQLARRVLVADGAMGTMLYSKGVFINRCFDELNLSSPALVKEIHEEYVKAGAEIIETNTFGANRPRLAAFGFAEKLQAINQAGVRLAREAAGEAAFVAGSVGPLGVRIEPLGPTSFEEARALFREHIEALVEAGVDLVILETFSVLNELREAILAAREAAGDEMRSSPRSPSTTTATCPTARLPRPSRASSTNGPWTSPAATARPARR